MQSSIAARVSNAQRLLRRVALTLRAALDAGLAGQPIAVAQTQPYGCEVKY